jgi:2-iminobutanoate/2-iminopropanoate deaminase
MRWRIDGSRVCHRQNGLENRMTHLGGWLPLLATLLLPVVQVNAERLEYIGKPVRGIPVSQAVKVGKLIFVSGTPAFDGDGKLAVGDFAAQVKQAMDNVTATLKASGAGWDRVVKTNVLLIRASDFAEMNRIYATYFPDGKYPARTTVVVAGLPHPDFLLEIECEAIIE